MTTNVLSRERAAGPTASSDAVRRPRRRHVGSAPPRCDTRSSTSACRRCARATCPAERLDAMEPFYPLHARVCERCLLVQLEEFVAPEEIFSEYAYFSSYSDSWVEHARRVRRPTPSSGSAIGPDSLVIELASNDGYLLQHVRRARHSRRSGSSRRPTSPAAARERGIETIVRFFGRELAAELVAAGRRADLLVANNVLAHVPDLNDFVARDRDRAGAGRRGDDRVPAPAAPDRGQPVRHDLPRALLVLLVPDGSGGSGRPRAGRVRRRGAPHPRRLAAPVRPAAATGRSPPCPTASASLADRERALGYDTLAAHTCFSARVIESQVEAARVPDRGPPRRQAGRRLRRAGQGQHAAQLLRDPDRPARVHGRPQPVQAGTVPARHAHPDPRPEALEQERPDYILILPWNLKREIVAQLAHAREWGARFVVPIPEVEVL